MIEETTSRHWLWSGYALAIVFCVVFAVIATKSVWPPMDGDAAMLFPPAVEFARGNGLVNTPWLGAMNDTIDGPGGRRHISHGFLYQLLLGMAGKATGSDVQGVVAWVHLFAVAAAAACGAAILVWYRKSSEPKWHLFILGALSVLASFGLTYAWYARGETMVMLWYGCALLALRFFSGNTGYFIAGLALGLTAWTSPVSAFIGAFALGILIFCGERRKILPAIGWGMGGSGLATAFAWTIYPYPFVDWVGGTIRHSRVHFNHPAFEGLWRTWVIKPTAPLLVLTVLILLISTLLVIWKASRLRPLWQQLVVAACVMMICIAMFRFTVMRGEAVYNWLPWIPVMAAVIAYGLRGRMASICLLIALLFPSLGIARSAVILASQLSTGPTYEEVRTLIAEKQSDGILISKAFWIAASDLSKAKFGTPEYVKDKPQWFIDQQVATGRAKPDQYRGYRLVENKFYPAVKFLGIPISNTPTGWQYALYEKEAEGN